MTQAEQIQILKTALAYYATPQPIGCWDPVRRGVGSIDDDDEQPWSRFAMGVRARVALDQTKPRLIKLSRREIEALAYECYKDWKHWSSGSGYPMNGPEGHLAWQRIVADKFEGEIEELHVKLDASLENIQYASEVTEKYIEKTNKRIATLEAECRAARELRDDINCYNQGISLLGEEDFMTLVDIYEAAREATGDL